MQSKAELRRRFLQARRQTSQTERERIDRAIAQTVVQLDAFRSSTVIFAYFSTAEEISTQRIIDTALQCGKTVCLPKCLPQHRMEARQILSARDLTEETYGIREPGAHCLVISPQQIDFCLVPALACDRQGYRLGYGGGFYDRYLPKTAGQTVCLCAESRLVACLPSEPFDIRCSCIITENEVYCP